MPMSSWRAEKDLEISVGYVKRNLIKILIMLWTSLEKRNIGDIDYSSAVICLSPCPNIICTLI